MKQPSDDQFFTKINYLILYSEISDVIPEDSEYKSEIQTALSAAVRAGEKIDELRESGVEIEQYKGGRDDFVTNADYAAEDMIREQISESHPEDGIVSEESELVEGESNRVWIIDPIDGTTNYERGWRYYCISIALRINEEYVVGAVHSPPSGLNRTYLASVDTGAYRYDGEPSKGCESEIHVSNRNNIEDSMCTCFMSQSNYERRKIERDIVENLLENGANYRETGSGALTLCEIAESGRDCRFDIVDEWDYAAASIILERAGGTFEQYPKDSIIATNGALHNEFKAIVDPIIKKHPTKNLITQ